MSRQVIIRRILDTGLLPTFYDPNPETAVEISNACVSGGVEAVEFTNRGEFAFEVFRKLMKASRTEASHVVLGVGTILDPATASLYINSGAQFVVGPVFNPAVAKICNRRKVVYIPGCGTCSEISRAEEAGVELVKVFPARVLGPYFIKALLGPCPWFKLIPSGGVEATRESVTDWIKSGAAALNIGGSLISKDLVGSGNFGGIAKRVQSVLNWINQARA